MRQQALSLIALTVALASPGFSQDPVTIGVLEWSKCSPQAPETVSARLLFQQQGAQWIALTDPQDSQDHARQSWVVAFDGRNLGSVVTLNNGLPGKGDRTHARDHLLQLASEQPPPHVRNISGTFSREGSWCGPSRWRPLVLVSQANVSDPQRWRPFKPDSSARRALFKTFRAVGDTLLMCPKGPDRSAQAWEYGPSDLAFEKSYHDTLGHQLLSLRLKEPANACEFTAGPEWSAHWFLVAQDTLYLASELELVDAGDYDGDGDSEVLFWHTGYDEDGYTLFYDHLRKRVDYWWHHH